MLSIYVRVSSEQQRDNYSIQAQRQDGISFAKRKGETYHVFEDVWSGKDITRDGWTQFIKTIESGNATCVWASAFDRLSRNTAEGLRFIELLRQKNIALYVLGIQYDPNDANVELLITMQFAFATLEGRRIAQRTLLGKRKSIDAGRRKIPRTLGYDVLYTQDGKRYSINEEEAKTVRYVYDLIEKGVSFKKIAMTLNTEGYKTKLGKALFSQTHISGIARRPEYAGITWNFDRTELIPSIFYDPIIEQERWRHIQTYLDKVCPERNRNGIRLSHYRLSGILKCEDCGASYYKHERRWNTPDGQKSDIRYSHKNDTAKHKACNNRPKNILTTELDDAIEVLYINTFTNMEELERLAKLYTATLKHSETTMQDTLERLEDRLTEIEQKRKRLIDGVMVGNFTNEDIADNIKQLNTDKSRYEGEKKRMRKDLSFTLRKYSDILDEFSSDQLTAYTQANNDLKRKHLHKVIAALTVKNKEITLRFITDRVIVFNVKEKPAWLLAQEDSLRQGIYTADYISRIRNVAEATWKRWKQTRPN